MNILKLATHFAAGIILVGLLCVSVKADSVIVVDGGTGAPLNLKIANPAADTNANLAFEVDSISTAKLAHKSLGNSFVLSEITTTGQTRSNSADATSRRTITLTLHDFSGNVVVVFKKGNGGIEKPVGCLGCSGGGVTTMPEPASLLLLGSGLIGVSAMVRRQLGKKRN